MNQEQLQAIRERVKKATPGPWMDAVGCVYVGRPGRMIVDAQACENLDANTEFIAHAREDVPALLDEIERLQKENSEMSEVLMQSGERLLSATVTETKNRMEIERLRKALEFYLGEDDDYDAWLKKMDADCGIVADNALAGEST